MLLTSVKSSIFALLIQAMQLSTLRVVASSNSDTGSPACCSQSIEPQNAVCTELVPILKSLFHLLKIHYPQYTREFSGPHNYILELPESEARTSIGRHIIFAFRNKYINRPNLAVQGEINQPIIDQGMLSPQDEELVGRHNHLVLILDKLIKVLRCHYPLHSDVCDYVAGFIKNQQGSLVIEKELVHVFITQFRQRERERNMATAQQGRRFSRQRLNPTVDMSLPANVPVGQHEE